MVVPSRTQKAPKIEINLMHGVHGPESKAISLRVKIGQHHNLSEQVNSITRSCYNELPKLYKIQNTI